VANSTIWWAPVFKGREVQSRLMSIPWRAEEPPTERQYKDALVNQIDSLIRANRKEARWALDVEFSSICTTENCEHWAMQIGSSPQMNMMLARINWEAPSERFVLDGDEDIPTLSDYVDGLGVE